MASIALRNYLNEINDMIDHRQIEEAISHCRHILERYPKHVDTYRLLGKAYLEEQRYGDAADILQRVLSSVPDDFIAHVGMSIIREDEGNIDAAIYHMERAFETQPSNHAIQDELRRLMGIRDGVEPPRVRLTRGALARMYAHGHLYDQAIAELQAAISEDPQRLDLMTLLAEMFDQAGKKVDAAETSTKILEKLPNCLSANRLLAKILAENDRLEEAARYRNKWEDLDPYAEYIGDDYPKIDQVPDGEVSLQKLEWEPESFGAGRPAWATSLGMSLDEEEAEREEELPGWLTPDEEEEEEADLIPEIGEDDSDEEFISEQPISEEDLSDEFQEAAQPDWMATQEDDAEFETFEEEEPLPDFLTEAEESEEDEDDWLTALEAAEDEPAPSSSIPGEEEEMPDWLTSVDQPDEEETDDAGEEDWLTSLEETPEEEVELGEESEEDVEIPDFLKEAGWEKSTGELAEQEPISYIDEEEAEDDIEEGEIPEWLKDMAPSGETQPESTPSDVTAEPDPEWLKELDSQAAVEAPDWLSELDQDTAEDTEDIPSTILPEMEEAGKGKEIEAEDEDMAWLESLAAKQGIPEEELVTSPEQRALVDDSHPPEGMMTEEAGEEEAEGEAEEDWFAGLETEAEVEETAEEEDVPVWLSTPVETEAEAEAEDDWLAGLETEEEVEETAEEEEEPDWLSTMDETEAEAEAEDDWLVGLESEEEVEETAEEEEEPDWLSTPVETEAEDEAEDDWLAGLETEEEVEETAEEEEPDWLSTTDETEAATEAEDDWLAALETEGETEEPPEEEAEEAPAGVLEEEDDFDMDWLDEIGQEAAEEAAATSMEAPSEAEPAPAAEEEEEEEDWLSSLGEAEAETEAEDDWLAALETEEEVEETAEEEEEPDWLSTTDETEAATKAEDDWLAALETEAEEPAEEEAEEAPAAVLEEEDDFDMDWLDEIGQEAAEEAAATSAEEPEEIEAEEQPGELTAPWLTEVAAETDADQIPGEDETISQFIAQIDEEQPSFEETPETPVEPKPEIDPEASIDTAALGETDAWLSEIGQDEPEEEPAEALDAGEDQVPEEQPEPEETPDWLQEPDFEQDIETETSAFAPEEDELPEEEEAAVEEPTAEVPDQADEWVPESAQEISREAKVEEAASDQIPAAPEPDSPEGILETARSLIESGNIDESIKTYSRLIKKGKKIPEIVEDIKEAIQRHPVDYHLWQLLGDAYQRVDKLQEALDAYTKAEELLR